MICGGKSPKIPKMSKKNQQKFAYTLKLPKNPLKIVE